MLHVRVRLRLIVVATLNVQLRTVMNSKNVELNFVNVASVELA